ncbi:hypothetical protein HDV04_001242 [Boothiomyces sp. JEL0838]|nr:hypothetical protein HDV04_001242 [Boothiomyces sp. JEL0838]
MDAANLAVLGITATLLAVCIILFFKAVLGKLVSPTFKTKVLIILIITIVQSSIIIYNIQNDYQSYTARIPGFLAQCTEFMICLFNIHILQVFSLLNPNITTKKLMVWKIFVTVLFVLSIIPQVWMLSVIDANQIPFVIFYWNGYSSTAFTVFSVLYDNIQGLYLIYLVLKNKKKKGKEVVRILNGLVTSLIVLAVMDWFGVIVYSGAIFIPAIYNSYDLASAIVTFVETYTGIHGVLIIYLLKQLTDFTFADSKKHRAQRTPQIALPPEPEITFGEKTIPLNLIKGEAKVPVSREPSSQPATVFNPDLGAVKQ